MSTPDATLNASTLASLNNSLWISFKSLGKEITLLGETAGHELRVKSKDCNRAVVTCSRSGIYSPLGTQRCTTTIKCNCPFKINLKRCIYFRLTIVENSFWKVYNFRLDHNHGISVTAGLIKSYKKLSTLIWHDLKIGVLNNALPRELILHIRDTHPVARRVS
jgi:hypothetical protein